MELCGHGYLEGLRNPPWEANAPTEMNELFSSDWNYDFFEDYHIPFPSSHFPNYCSSQEPLLSPPTHHPDQNIFTELHQYPLSIESLAHQLLDSPISPPRIASSSYSPCDDDAPLFPVQEMTLPLSMVVEEGETTFLHADDFNQALGMRGDCKPESMESLNNQVPVNFEAGPRVGAKNNRARKKLEGQPSKNLMAERRRRKRLNDRLLMLRSIIPKISKMDRTSILRDTIDYMKELLQKINYLQYHSFGPYHLNIMDIIKDMKPNEMLVRKTPKFDVERRNVETRIEICCAAKPGLLLSTVSKLESLGLDIQECVISCFNDFAMQASCSEEMQQRDFTSTGDIKQALSKNAGYRGRCL